MNPVHSIRMSAFERRILDLSNQTKVASFLKMAGPNFARVAGGLGHLLTQVGPAAERAPGILERLAGKGSGLGEAIAQHTAPAAVARTGAELRMPIGATAPVRPAGLSRVAAPAAERAPAATLPPTPTAPHNPTNWTSGGGAPGVVSPTDMVLRGERGMAAGTARPNWTRGASNPVIDAEEVGGPGANWMHKRFGVGPEFGPFGGRFGKQLSWINSNPDKLKQWGGNAGFAGGGFAASQGMDAYGHHRKREALRNMGAMDRLGLAFHLMTNPNQVADKFL